MGKITVKVTMTFRGVLKPHYSHVYNNYVIATTEKFKNTEVFIFPLPALIAAARFFLGPSD